LSGTVTSREDVSRLPDIQDNPKTLLVKNIAESLKKQVAPARNSRA